MKLIFKSTPKKKAAVVVGAEDLDTLFSSELSYV